MNQNLGPRNQTTIDRPAGNHPAPHIEEDTATLPLKATNQPSRRASRLEVRNPVLALPAVARLRALDPEARQALQEILLDIQSDARARAEKCWRSHKPPVAAYWAACGVYAGHIARSIGPLPGRRSSSRRVAQI